MYKKLVKQLAKRLGYTVYSVDFEAKHYTFSFKEACEWMKCYPASDTLFVWHDMNIVARRN